VNRTASLPGKVPPLAKRPRRPCGGIGAAGSAGTRRTAGANCTNRATGLSIACTLIPANTDADSGILIQLHCSWTKSSDGSAGQSHSSRHDRDSYNDCRLSDILSADLRGVLRAGRLLPGAQIPRGVRRLHVLGDRRGAQHLRKLHAATTQPAFRPAAGRGSAARAGWCNGAAPADHACRARFAVRFL